MEDTLLFQVRVRVFKIHPTVDICFLSKDEEIADTKMSVESSLGKRGQQKREHYVDGS